MSDADCLQNEQKLNDPTTEKKEMLKTKSALVQTEVSIKDPDTLRSGILSCTIYLNIDIDS